MENASLNLTFNVHLGFVQIKSQKTTTFLQVSHLQKYGRLICLSPDMTDYICLQSIYGSDFNLAFDVGISNPFMAPQDKILIRQLLCRPAMQKPVTSHTSVCRPARQVPVKSHVPVCN